MSDLFDDMIGGDPLDDRRDANLPPPALGLVVAEKAPDGHVLEIEARVLQEMRGFPTCVFIEEDPDTGEEVFANARAFADAMQLGPGVLPTEGQALAWVREKEAAAYQKHLPAIKAAYAEAYTKKK